MEEEEGEETVTIGGERLDSGAEEVKFLLDCARKKRRMGEEHVTFCEDRERCVDPGDVFVEEIGRRLWEEWMDRERMERMEGCWAIKRECLRIMNNWHSRNPLKTL